MTKQLLDLGDVPINEANEIKSLLVKKGIIFYETPEGNWGRSMEAIWITNDKQYTKALKVINDYYSWQRKKTYRNLDKDLGKSTYVFIKNVLRIYKENRTLFAFYLLVFFIVIILFFRKFQ